MLTPRGGLDHRFGDLVDQAGAKKWSRIALGALERDRPVPLEHPLAPDPVIGVVPVSVQNDARRIAKARMDPHQCGELRPLNAPGPIRRLAWVAKSVFKSVSPVTERECVEKSGRTGPTAIRPGGDDLDVLVEGPSAPWSRLMMAAGARALVIDRAQSIAAVASPIVRDPLAGEEIATQLDFLRLLGLSLTPVTTSSARTNALDGGHVNAIKKSRQTTPIASRANRSG